ncbi:MAG: pteridine reductase [Arenicella sp.]
MNKLDNIAKVALITGGARRIGAEIAKTLHYDGYNILVHYRHSSDDAKQLCADLNGIRPNSCHSFQADLADSDAYEKIIQNTIHTYGQLDALINNASSFYPTPIEEVTEAQWQDLLTSNLKAPIFLSKYATPWLKKTKGSIINIIDIYANRPLANHPIYCAAKAGTQSLTKSLARDLNGEVRVNGVAPGAILWPEDDAGVDPQQAILARIPMNTLGEPQDIAKTIRFLLNDAPYINGQIISVDGGRSVMP